VRYSYLKGSTTIIDLLEAQRSWLDTRQQYYDTEMQYRKATIELLFVTGLINQLAQ
jgi:cobalt-zinc-cadmium efflux system outer membrane protein